jgi:uncharacterized secreted protein with C-terminal beta-propeller domain
MLMSANDPAKAIGPLGPAAKSNVTEITASAAEAIATRVASPAASLTDTKKNSSPTNPILTEHFLSNDDFSNWLIQAATAQWGQLFGQRAYPMYYSMIWAADDRAFALNDFTVSGTANTLDTNSSSTNVQVDGVDEADLVETDGNYLYILSNDKLVIVRAGEGGDLEVLSRVQLDDHPVGMYLSGDRLAIVSSSNDQYSYGGGRGVRLLQPLITNVWTGEAQWSPPTTTVMVLDLTDRSAPTLVQKTKLDGRLVSSRTVDGQLRLVLSNDLHLPMPITKPADPESNGDEWLAPIGRMMTPIQLDANIDVVSGLAINVWQPYWAGSNAFYESLDEYIARVSNEVLDSLGTRVRSFAADGTVISDTPLFDAADVYRPDDMSARNATTIATFDLHSNQAGPTAKATVLTGNDSQIYATSDSIYVFASKSPEVNRSGLMNFGVTAKTSVWMFSFDAARHSIDLAAKGDFDGDLLNQFAADERDGYLRVVTNSNNANHTGESVLVLKAVNHHFNVVASITGIAEDESLYSVRFIGDRVFFVTYRQIDPLFAVDLSDPLHPQMMGELHIPGYSEYLQPIDATHLLAIGRGTVFLGDGWEEPDSLQISIFDVSNMEDPRLVDRYTFGGGYSTVTPATGFGIRNVADDDHHAVSYFADEHILALPVESNGYGVGWGDADAPLFEPGEGGLQVFKIDAAVGFISLGLIEHDTPIERSLRIGQRLYAISDDSVSVHPLTDPSRQLCRVNIGANDGVQTTELKMYRNVRENPIKTLLEQSNREPNETSITEKIDRTVMMIESRADGFLRPVGTSRPAQRAIFADSNELASTLHVDNELLQVLATHAAEKENGFNAFGSDDSAIMTNKVSDYDRSSEPGSSNLNELSCDWLSSADFERSTLS